MGPSSDRGAVQGMINNIVAPPPPGRVAPPPPSWSSISRPDPNNWEDEPPRGGMSNQFSGGQSGGFANSIQLEMNEMKEKIQNLQARGFSQDEMDEMRKKI